NADGGAFHFKIPKDRFENRQPRGGQRGGWLPSGMAGRAQYAGVFERTAAWVTARSWPKPEGTSSTKRWTVSPDKSSVARPSSTRPRFHSHRPVWASETRTCQLPPSRDWRSRAIIAPNAIR